MTTRPTDTGADAAADTTPTPAAVADPPSQLLLTWVAFKLLLLVLLVDATATVVLYQNY